MSDILKLSVSKTKTFLDCKKKYKFSYIQKLPKKERDYHIFGKFCHKVLEDFHIFYINGSTDLLHVAMSKAYKNALAEYKDKMTADMKSECKSIIDKYLQIVVEDKKNNKSPNVIACEKEFNFPINENVILNGMIDRVQIDADNVIHVCDYKTTKNKKFLKNDFFQLLTYAYVMIKDDPTIQKVRGSYILLRHDFEYITIEFGLPEILVIKEKYINYANQIMSETEFPPNPTILCNYCDFLDVCDSAGSIVKKSEKFGEVSW